MATPLGWTTALLLLALSVGGCSRGPAAAERFQGRTLDEWLARTHDLDAATRVEAERAFRRLGTTGITYLRTQLDSRDPEVSNSAWSTLMSLCATELTDLRREQAAHPHWQLAIAIQQIDSLGRTGAEPERCH